MGEEEQELVTDPSFGTQLPSPGCHGTDCSSLGCQADQTLLKEALGWKPHLSSPKLPTSASGGSIPRVSPTREEQQGVQQPGDLSRDIPILQTACKSEKVRI